MGLDYTGDLRAILVHAGNENSGRYPRGSGDRPFQHIGRHFGKRKYQNPDGTLTPAGRARFESEKRKNSLKKKDNRVKDEDDLIDPDRWSQEDTEAAINTSKASENLIQVLSDMHKKFESTPTPRKLDLSSMTDEDLRSRINRMQLETQYARLYNEQHPSKISKGKRYYEDILKRVGSALTVTTSALTLSLAIKRLMR